MRSVENQSSTTAPVYFLLQRRGKGNKCGGGHTTLNQHLQSSSTLAANVEHLQFFPGHHSSWKNQRHITNALDDIKDVDIQLPLGGACYMPIYTTETHSCTVLGTLFWSAGPKRFVRAQ